MTGLLERVEGYKTILGVLALVVYNYAVSRGYLVADEAVRTAIYGWILYGLGDKIDRKA